MKLICKIICRILWIFIWFILINLIIWTIIYWWTKKYSEILNQKDWQQNVSEFSLFKPKTRVAMFYDLEWWEEKVQELSDIDNENISDVNRILEEFLSWEYDDEINHNPYDPDYEDEFNSFFGGSSKEDQGIIPVEEIEDLEPAWFVVNESTGD